MADVFSDNADNSNQSVLEALVGEGKKFQDPEALARGKAEADKYIEQLKEDKARLESELATRSTVEDMLKKVVPNPVSANQPQVEQGKALSEDDLKARIVDVLSAAEKEKQVVSNVQTVANKLVELYGSEAKAQEVVKAKAKELNVSTKFLQDVAAHSPTAFFSTIGVNNPNTQVNPGVTRSDVNPSALPQFNNTSTHAPGSYDEYRAQAGNDIKKLMDPKYLGSVMDAALKNPDKVLSGARFAS